MACDAVVLDNERGGREATEHLLELGHTRIALLVADTDWTSDAGRLHGYVAAHVAHGADLDERLILPLAFHAPDAEERIGALLAERRPTAIFAANNELAEHAWRVVPRRGLRLPHDISLVGFDDVGWMAMVDPGITVVAQPAFEPGRRPRGSSCAGPPIRTRRGRSRCSSRRSSCADRPRRRSAESSRSR